MADNYTQDSFIVSVVWGRVGAAVLALGAFILGYFGYTFAPEAQAQAFTLVSSICAGIGGILAIISKIRESKKIAG